MTDQPTDHRAEGEAMLADIREQGDPFTSYTITEMALIGIGHALLALGQEYRITAPNPDDIGGTTWRPLQPERLEFCTYREQVHGIEKGCAGWAGHAGDHHLTVFTPAPHPPLSPSEG